MASLSPVTAGRRVRQIAHAFMDDLLDDETATFARIADSYRVGLDARAREVRSAVGDRDVSVVTSTGVIDKVTAAWERAAGQASKQVETLVQTAVEKAMAAVEKELRLCERTLASRYAGIADEACEIAWGDVDVLVDAELAAWDPEVAYVLEWMPGALREQARAAKDVDDLLARWFSETPVGKRGFSGRGIWWRGTSNLNAVAQGASVHGANRTRTTAMMMMNMIATERDEDG